MKHGAFQPWDVINHFKLTYFDGNAVKYLLRWRDKGGVEDLEKARHYIEKLLEIERRKEAEADSLQRATVPPATHSGRSV